MTDPSFALQAAIVAALKRCVELSIIIDDRIYDQPPALAVYPYITLGDGQVIGDDSDGCGEGSEIIQQIDTWSRTPGYGQTKLLAAAVRSALAATPDLAGFSVTVVHFQQCQFLRDPDGLTRHAAIQIRYLISHLS